MRGQEEFSVTKKGLTRLGNYSFSVADAKHIDPEQFKHAPSLFT